jgi:YVTN family beta-propeller protein
MRFLKMALLCGLLVAVPFKRLHAGGDQYVPPPPPDIPFPDDPPDPFTDPFDPNSDIPLPDIPDLPPEIPFPDPPFDDDIPIPDPPDIDDPFPDLPSLDPGDLADDFEPPPTSSPKTNLRGADQRGADQRGAAQAPAAVNTLSRLMPFPNRLPFHPAYSGVSAPASTKRSCAPATGTTLLIPESKKNTLALLGTCPVGIIQRIPVGNYPVAVRQIPNSPLALVANAGDGTISVVDLVAGASVATIQLPPFDGFPAVPNDIAILPDGSRAYVTDHDSDPGSLVYVIDLITRTVITQVAVGAFPASIAVTPDGTQVWVPCRGDGDLFVIDTLTNTVVGFNANITLATGVAINPTGTKVYVAEGNDLGGIVDQIDMTTFQIVSRIQVGGLPHALLISPSGRHMFVTNALSNTISIININTNTVIQTINLKANHPLGLAWVRNIP